MSYRRMGVILSVTLAGGAALASPSPAPSPEGANPCHAIATACESAGYVKHGKEKDLWKDCMHPILSGQTVKGVDVDAADVQACEARHEEKEKLPK
jgi:hypothetical protein